MLKTSISFSLITAYLIGFSYYGVNAYEKIFNPSSALEEGTTVGPIQLGGQTAGDSVKLVNNEIEKWQQSKTITLQYVEKSVPLDLSLIHFSVEESINNAVPGETGLLVVDVVEEQVKEDVLREFPIIEEKSFDFNGLDQELQETAAALQPGESVIDLTRYLSEPSKQAIVSEAIMTNSAMSKELQAFIQQNAQMTIRSNRAFSFNEWMRETGSTGLSEKDKNQLASLLYKIVLETNFLIFEKNQSAELPPYLELGYEAKVSEVKDQDFIFMNGNLLDYTIEWKAVNGKLYGALKGVPFTYTYQAVLKNKQMFQPKTILQFTPQLPYGKMVVKEPGTKGVAIEVYRETSDALKKRKEEKVAEDFYPPTHRIEQHSSLTPPAPKPSEKPAQPNGGKDQKADPNKVNESKKPPQPPKGQTEATTNTGNANLK
ncbi:hypothetical protein CD798_01715 [Bacillaceae bacterium SAOS 7]|nr:hypothetical protein CD798_01715 [Bacillaceae bacterium SAOS 7]